jgi:hypothetical protein
VLSTPDRICYFVAIHFAQQEALSDEIDRNSQTTLDVSGALARRATLQEPAVGGGVQRQGRASVGAFGGLYTLRPLDPFRCSRSRCSVEPLYDDLGRRSRIGSRGSS